MADHLKPTITSTYSNFVTEMDARFDDLAVGLDPAVTSATNVPVNATRWSSASNKWQKYNGTAWNDLSALYSINISGNAGTVTNGVYTNGSYSNPSWITSLVGSKITGDIAGNAGTATALATARNINGVAFNGTTAISVNLNNSITFNNTGAGGASGTAFNGGSASTISYNTVGAPSVTGVNASGTWGISITGNAATVTNGVYNDSGTYGINITGNAATVTNGVYNDSGTYGINITGNAATATTATNGGVTSVNGATGAVTITSIGVSQTWQNVTASRSIGTTYTNSTGRSIMLNLTISNGSYQTSVLTVSGLTIGRVSNPTTSSGAEATLSAIIPNGATYSASGGISGWYELR